jgi:hypothetical protein
MSTNASVLSTTAGYRSAWLRSKDWDLTWISLSVVLVATPYLVYLGLIRMEVGLTPLAVTLGTTVEDLSRNLVNGIVALLVGGPHMYATFTRTALDHRYASTHRQMLYSSLVIPVIVILLALSNLSLLLTLFFFWASIHVLHQIIYIIDLYNHRERTHRSLISRLSDYAVVVTALYPLAAYRIYNGTFLIGTNDLSKVVGAVFPRGAWMVWLAGGAFVLALAFWLWNLYSEHRQGTLFWPKTFFIGLTVTAAFFVPALGNLDTAFQGMNVWHSLQYLALTWMLNNLRQRSGELDDSPFVKRLSTDGSARRYYTINIIFTIADGLLALVIFAVMVGIFKMPFDYAFDRSYYIAVLSFLLVHYYHDHFLFARPEVIG